MSEGINCKLDALSEQEKEKRDTLLEKMKFAITDVVETENGYDISVVSNLINIIDVDNITQLERKCCPFLEFDSVFDGGITTIKVTGPSGTKQLIVEQFGLII
ncbi:MAG: hypothetical protein GWO07_02450 [Candidatus Dadabacteria bacterium]|nr:hypothetical protein [Candidatus Dadabacteria bacterium]NIS07629.1 hypothetical protein [Candidatus Dadabacteria bacterium]NIV42083.1 hypothetical protein [Candidatus Dadabacteria bacterium]NIX16488.1 hypothetical protein [Candidatus Dadabacteria bacterium]NIY21267.1 hypothetical protein [Candidatus Dadabacteria bacterium]